MLDRLAVLFVLAALTACDIPDVFFIKIPIPDPDACMSLQAHAYAIPSGHALPVSVAAADLNGDRKPDLIVTNSGTDTVSVLLGNGDGTFQVWLEYPTGSR